MTVTEGNLQSLAEVLARHDAALRTVEPASDDCSCEVARLERKLDILMAIMAETLVSIDTLTKAVGPIMGKIEKSPIMKMLGGK